MNNALLSLSLSVYYTQSYPTTKQFPANSPELVVQQPIQKWVPKTVAKR